MRNALSLSAALLLTLAVAGLAACGTAPDGRSVQQAVDEAAAGAE